MSSPFRRSAGVCLLALLAGGAPPLPAAEVIQSDLCVFGATSAGVAAAVQAAREGRKVVLTEFGGHLGGMTAGGLSQTDIGNKGAIGGIAREFYRRGLLTWEMKMALRRMLARR